MPAPVRNTTGPSRDSAISASDTRRESMSKRFGSGANAITRAGRRESTTGSTSPTARAVALRSASRAPRSGLRRAPPRSAPRHALPRAKLRRAPPRSGLRRGPPRSGLRPAPPRSLLDLRLGHCLFLEIDVGGSLAGLERLGVGATSPSPHSSAGARSSTAASGHSSNCAFISGVTTCSTPSSSTHVTSFPAARRIALALEPTTSADGYGASTTTYCTLDPTYCGR